MRGAGWLLVAWLSGCVRPVHVETRETPVETGIPVPFVAEAERHWEFGDGSPGATGAQVHHAFQRAGRYVVRGYQGDTLRDEFTLVVRPRLALRLVPPDVSFAAVARSLDDLAPAVDFAERLVGPQPMQGFMDRSPLVAWALDEHTAGRQGSVDAREGLARFTWPSAGEDAQWTVVGVQDDAAALSSLQAFLVAHEWSSIGHVQGLWRYELEGRALDVFVDRGALYGVETGLTERLPSAQARVSACPEVGLELDGMEAAALDALPSGGLVLFARAPEALSWRFATATVRLEPDEAHVEGRLHGRGPLWVAPALAADRFLSRAPDGPVLVGSASLPPAELAALLLGAPGGPRRKALEADLQEQGTELQKVIAAFPGDFGLAVYADVPGFVRSTLAAEGRPVPSGTVLFEAPVLDAKPIEGLVEALGIQWGLGLLRANEKQLRVWRGTTSGRRVEIALTNETLYGRAGADIAQREAVDLAGGLSKRFEGAFTAGHLSLFLDVGQLRRELLLPRLMRDVDPRKALTAQALAVTLLDRLTQLDSALVDLSPSSDGASVQLVLKLRPRSTTPDE